MVTSSWAYSQRKQSSTYYLPTKFHYHSSYTVEVLKEGMGMGESPLPRLKNEKKPRLNRIKKKHNTFLQDTLKVIAAVVTTLYLSISLYKQKLEFNERKKSMSYVSCQANMKRIIFVLGDARYTFLSSLHQSTLMKKGNRDPLA